MMVLPLLRDILRTSQAQRRTDRQNVRQALLTAEDRGITFWGQSLGSLYKNKANVEACILNLYFNAVVRGELP